MIAQAFLLDNIEEIQAAKMRIERLGVREDIPEPRWIEQEFCFPLNSMLFAFRNKNGDIKTFIGGQEVILKWDEQVYNRIKEHFKNI